MSGHRFLRILKSDSLLLLTAAIWGSAFVAQRVGMHFMEPFLFNGIRFALGAASLTVFRIVTGQSSVKPRQRSTLVYIGGLFSGLVLFTAVSFQQIGIIYTTAGKSGFITGLYVLLVPLLGLLRKQKIGAGHWIGALCAFAGLYFLSVTEHLTIGRGDLLVLVSAFFWAIHVHVIGYFSPRSDPIVLSALQFAVCSLLSLFAAFLFETVSWEIIQQAYVPILYGGLLSVGIAYTLQVVAQRIAPPAHAAIILSTEGPFAILAGWIVLGEVLGTRGIIGCLLMFCGMLAAQFSIILRKAP